MEQRIRRQPLVIPPHPDEQFSGWLARWAADVRCPVGLLVEAVGLPRRMSGNGVQPIWADVMLTADSAEALRLASGLSPAKLAGGFLTRYHGSLLDLSRLQPERETSAQPASGKLWALLRGTRACPKCLATDGLWRTWWKLGLAGVCPIHGCLLIDACSRCTAPLLPAGKFRLTGRAQIGPACWRCGADLRTADHAVSAPPTTVAAQQVFLAAEGVSTHAFGDQQAPIRAWAAELYATAALIRNAPTQPSEHDWPVLMTSAVADTKLRTFTPRSAAVAAVVLDRLQPLITARDGDAVASAVEKLIHLAAAAPSHGKRSNLGALERLPILGTMVSTIRPRQARVSAHLTRRPSPDQCAPACRHEYVPPLIAASAYRSIFASLLPGLRETTGRRYISIAVHRLIGASSWAEAIKHQPDARAAAAAAVDIGVRRTVDGRALGSAVRRLTQMLAAEAINYTDRRRRLTGLHMLEAKILRALDPPIIATQAARRNAAAWLWSELCADTVDLSPAFRQARARGQSGETLNTVYARFERKLTTERRAALVRHGQSLCERS